MSNRGAGGNRGGGRGSFQEQGKLREASGASEACNCGGEKIPNLKRAYQSGFIVTVIFRIVGVSHRTKLLLFSHKFALFNRSSDR